MSEGTFLTDMEAFFTKSFKFEVFLSNLFCLLKGLIQSSNDGVKNTFMALEKCRHLTFDPDFTLELKFLTERFQEAYVNYTLTYLINEGDQCKTKIRCP